jgi:hypothetical protein
MFKTTFIAAVSLIALGASPVLAGSMAALSGDNMISIVDIESRASKATIAVTGVDGRILGIDLRPSDGMLYALFADGTVATIDAMSGKATKVETLQTVPSAAGMVTADFNPVADAFRIMSSDGTNLRTKIVKGAVTTDKPHAFAADDMNKDAKPMIVAGAYSNSMKGAEKTALYTIDAATGVFATQNPPNDGIQKSIGKLGLDVSKGVAFDIVSDGKGGNTGYLVAGKTLHTVDISNGKTSAAGEISGIDGMVRDIAIMQ